jgi:hypothetical protein
VRTFKRDYVDGAELRDAEAVLAQLGRWIEDYNTQAPHSASRDAEPGRVLGGGHSQLPAVSSTLGSTPPSCPCLRSRIFTLTSAP